MLQFRGSGRMKASGNAIMLRLFLVLFLMCFILIFITTPNSPEFFVMIISSVINLIMVIYAIIRIRKDNNE